MNTSLRNLALLPSGGKTETMKSTALNPFDAANIYCGTTKVLHSGYVNCK
jgi:hypothetical protein